MPAPLHKILIIRLSSLGDVVLSSPLVRMVRRRFPESKIDFLVKTEYADLVRHNPHLSGVIELPATAGVADLRQMRRHISSTKYDLIIDIHESLRSRYLCLGAQNIVRIDKRKFARFMLVRFKWNMYERSGGAPSVAERYLETARPLGVEDDGGGLELFVTERDIMRAKEILSDAGLMGDATIIGICPSAKHDNKIWLKERFAEVGSGLVDGDGAVLLFGSAGEAARCEEIKGLLARHHPRPKTLNLAGRVSLLETAALMDKCSIIITNDSGLMHMAAARGRPVVAVFGPTVKEFGFFPFRTRSVVVETSSLPCRPCTHIGLPACPKGHFRCMNDIPSEQVLTAARSLMMQA